MVPMVVLNSPINKIYWYLFCDNSTCIPNASEESNDIKPEILCKFGFPATHESCQMVSVRLQELVDGVLRQGMGVTNVQGLQIVEFSFL